MLPFSLLAGCSDDGTISTTPASVIAKGNWQVSAAASTPAPLSAFSGNFSTAPGKISATVHSQSASSCIAPETSFLLTGTEDETRSVALSGPVAGGTMKLTGTLAEDGKSMSDASYSITGGLCGSAAKVQATAQAFQSITGTYAGNFSDPSGQMVAISASLVQSADADENGNFTLTGSANLPNNPCFPTSVPLSATQVTGGTFTFTYSAQGNSVTAAGTFSQDASTLTVTNWSATGTCGTDHGTGLMTRQGS